MHGKRDEDVGANWLTYLTGPHGIGHALCPVSLQNRKEVLPRDQDIKRTIFLHSKLLNLINCRRGDMSS